MNEYKKLKIAIIGAGSVEFCPKTLSDLLLSDKLNQKPLEIVLMDINERALEVSGEFAKKAVEIAKREVKLRITTNLDEALKNTDFVISAIEADRYHYWSMDFHIPKRYGFRQVYGENGGPGGMFHALRNMTPVMHIANRMEILCPDAWLINYTNPEAKIVEAVSKLTKIKAVGVCHGYEMGLKQIADILGMNEGEIDGVAHGLNHFGWFSSITEKKTGNDLYPMLKEKEKECHWLSEWDGLALSRIMLRTYGCYPYPGTNHVGEYIAWSDDFLASTKIQYFYDPVNERPWDTKNTPRFVYDFSSNPTGISLHDQNRGKEGEYEDKFAFENGQLHGSTEYGVPIIEAIVYNEKKYIPSLNVLNKGTMPDIMLDMCVEGPCIIDANGVHPVEVPKLPTAVNAMINTQGAITKILIDSFVEKSKNKLLEAMLLDPTVSSYNNAVALIDDMFERQKEVLPNYTWEK